MILHIYYHSTQPDICNFFVVDIDGNVVGGSRKHFLGKSINEDYDLSLSSTMKYYDPKYDDNTYPMSIEKQIDTNEYMRDRKQYIKKLISPRKTIDNFYF